MRRDIADSPRGRKDSADTARRIATRLPACLTSATTFALALLVLACGAPPRATAQGSPINVTFIPSDTTVAAGADFWISIHVTSASMGYDGFESVINYNRSVLSFLPTSPSTSAQGCLMSGACADALGNRACTSNNFVVVQSGADSVYATDVLNCINNYLTAPGKIFRYHFSAINAGVSAISVKNIRFSTSGPIVSGSSSGNATVHVTGTTAVGLSNTAKGLRISAAPNPFRGAVNLATQSELSGDQELVVHDLLGRRIRVISRGWQPAGTRQLAWDGRDELGSRVAPGLYLVTLRVGGNKTLAPVTLLR